MVVVSGAEVVVVVVEEDVVEVAGECADRGPDEHPARSVAALTATAAATATRRAETRTIECNSARRLARADRHRLAGPREHATSARDCAVPARPAGPCKASVGELEVTFLPDGFIWATPESSYPGSDESLWRANPHVLDEEGRFVMSLGALLVRTGERRILLDLGWGPTEQSIVDPATGATDGRIGGGALLGHLQTCGVRPEDVDTVLFSHLHRDHTGWLDQDGTPCFPNAEHLVAEAEWAYWSTTGEVGVGPAPTAQQLEVLAGRVAFVADGDTPAPGVDVLATPGHTPGHCSFVLSSGTERAVVLGDAVHCPLELLEPELAYVADVDPALAQRTRRQIEEDLLRPGTIAAGPHFADLVFGRLLPGHGKPTWHFPETQRSGPDPEPPA